MKYTYPFNQNEHPEPTDPLALRVLVHLGREAVVVVRVEDGLRV